MRASVLPAIGVLLALGGCALAPKYARPAMPVLPNLPESAAVAASDVPPTIPWQEFVTDSRLRSIVEQVLANNRDLRAAALNAERIGAQYRIQRAELFPAAGAAADIDVARVPRKLSPTGQAYTSDQYSVGGFTSWELDLFGRIRSLQEAALDQYLASRHVADATRTSLIAAAASTYLALAADAENLALAQSTLQAQQHSLDLIQRSRDAGIASDLDVRQAQTQVEAARAGAARYGGLVALDRHALELLAGSPIRAELLPANLAGVAPFKGMSPGVSSEILLHRPDILAAEYQLKAANANIGAARAAYLPRLSLTAALGLASPALADLFQGSARTWSFTPQLSAPIFTAGARRATAEAARIGRDAAIAQYEGAIQAAFREVSDGLALRGSILAQRVAEEALVEALDQTYRLSDARYKAGIDGYLGVLVAQRALFGAQQALVAARLAEQQNLVSLYKVLGGGV